MARHVIVVQPEVAQLYRTLITVTDDVNGTQPGATVQVVRHLRQTITLAVQHHHFNAFANTTGQRVHIREVLHHEHDFLARDRRGQCLGDL